MAIRKAARRVASRPPVRCMWCGRLVYEHDVAQLEACRNAVTVQRIQDILLQSQHADAETFLGVRDGDA